MAINSQKFFVNIKNPPVYDPNKHCFEQQQDVIDFYAQEMYKIKHGIIIDGVFIHPWLYFHANFYKFAQSEKALPDTALIRDTEWLFAECLDDAKKLNNGVFLFGSRRIGKSILESSFSLWNALSNPYSQNKIIYGLKEDGNILDSYITTAIANLPDFLKVQTDGGIGAKQLRLGIKSLQGTINPLLSSIDYINIEEGRGSKKVAGGTPTSWVFDEAGKNEIKDMWGLAKGSFIKEGGVWRCIPLLSGTSDTRLSQDVFEMLSEPSKHNIVPMNWDRLERGVDPEQITWTRKSFGLFLPAQLSLAGLKEEKTVADYIKPESEELKEIPMMITNWEKSMELIQKTRDACKGDQHTYNLEVSQYPVNIDEPFLHSDENPFPAEQLQRWKIRLKESGAGGTKVDILYNSETNQTEYKISDRDICMEFPFKRGGNIDAPILLFEEFPTTPPPRYLYCAGLDVYNYDTAPTSTSLGTCYVIKRDNGLDPMSRRIACSLSTRPKAGGAKAFYEKSMSMLMAFNAVSLPENNIKDFIEFMINKRKEHLLEKEPRTENLLNMGKIVRSSRYGYRNIDPWRIIKHAVDYTKEVIAINDDGTEVLGYTRIEDIMLLEEMIAYGGKETNFDRLIAFGLALMLDEYYTSLRFEPVKPKREVDEYKKRIPLKDKFKPKVYASKKFRR